MNEFFRFSLMLIFLFAALVFVLLFIVKAPYGKFSRSGWGPAVKSKWAWLVMEFPSPALMILLFLIAGPKSIPQIVFFIFWLMHYLHRTFIYSQIQSGRNKPYPLILVLMAFIFNCLNGFVNGFGIFNLREYDTEWLLSWQFISGSLIFICGFVINKISDEKLRHFRMESPSEYIIPHGWLFNYISSPHYFGEIIEWGGWALMTFSLPGLAFFLFTFANLFPRAISSHNWYKQNFPAYPAGRKAIIPLLI